MNLITQTKTNKTALAGKEYSINKSNQDIVHVSGTKLYQCSDSSVMSFIYRIYLNLRIYNFISINVHGLRQWFILMYERDDFLILVETTSCFLNGYINLMCSSMRSVYLKL